MREKIEEVIKDIGFDFQDHSKSDISYLFQMLRRAGIINFNVYRARGFHDNSGKWFRFQVEWYFKKIEHAIILDHDMSNHIEDIEDILGIIKHYNEKIKEIEKSEQQEEAVILPKWEKKGFMQFSEKIKTKVLSDLERFIRITMR